MCLELLDAIELPDTMGELTAEELDQVGGGKCLCGCNMEKLVLVAKNRAPATHNSGAIRARLEGFDSVAAAPTAVLKSPLARAQEPMKLGVARGLRAKDVRHRRPGTARDSQDRKKSIPERPLRA